MPYYSIPLALDTTAALGSEATLQDLLRDKMGFDGIIQTDWGMIWGIQQSASLWGEEISEEEAVLIGVTEGQVDGIGGESIRLIDTMEELYNEGMISDEILDAACLRILRAKFQLGVFEDPYIDVEYAVEYVGNEENQALNLQAGPREHDPAEKQRRPAPGFRGQEDSGVRPARRRYGFAVRRLVQRPAGLTIADAIAEYAAEDAEVIYEAEDVERIAELAAECDVVIVAVGEPSYMHSPPWGADTLELTDSQQEMLEAVKATGTPIVTVVVGGRPYILTWCERTWTPSSWPITRASRAASPSPKPSMARTTPPASSPFQMPRDMDSVLAQQGDVSFDIENPLYEYGFGPVLRCVILCRFKE